MLRDVAVVITGIFKEHMDPNSYVHGDKDGIHVYDINTPAEEIYQKLNDKERALLEKFGWIVDDGEFVKPN